MDLRCPECGRVYRDRWRCGCGSPLEFAASPDRAPEDGPGRDLETAAEPAPLEAKCPVERRVTLGEGSTPLLESPRWGVSFKLEYRSPTGSFKDRGAATTISRAIAVGADRVLEDSSGNAGLAIAAYAARADLAAEIYVPASAAQSTVAAIERTGADVVRVEGDREATTEACLDAVADGAGWYASHAWNPAFLAGTAAIAHEIAEQRSWTVPDVVVAPVGHGTLFLGAYRGFRTLQELGRIDEVPSMLAVQAAGHAPIVAALHGSSAAAGDNQLAAGLRVGDPARRGEILTAIEASDGDVLAVSEPAVESALDRLHGEGFTVEPTAAVAPAGLEVYRERGTIGEADDVVVPLTGLWR